MNKKSWFDKLQVWVIAGAIVTSVLVLVAVVYSLTLLSNQMYEAFSPLPASATTVNYNISGYNSLGLQ